MTFMTSAWHHIRTVSHSADEFINSLSLCHATLINFFVCLAFNGLKSISNFFFSFLSFWLKTLKTKKWLKAFFFLINQCCLKKRYNKLSVFLSVNFSPHFASNQNFGFRLALNSNTRFMPISPVHHLCELPRKRARKGAGEIAREL